MKELGFWIFLAVMVCAFVWPSRLMFGAALVVLLLAALWSDHYSDRHG